ncbi:MAG: aminomethyl-transferring glycine dehydrogenase subunit GcvPB [Candidatus Zixiibacteriota bacterium]
MKLLNEISKEGKRGFIVMESDVPKPAPSEYPDDKMIRDGKIGLPSVTEGEVMRHFVNLSTMNHNVDKGFYPLGSCTMKYNPKVNDLAASLPGFTELHPLMPEKTIQGALEVYYNLQEYLSNIAGMADTTLQPSAGAHGEFTGLMIIREYLNDQGDMRKKVLIPDSSHGTNPASIVFAGWEPVPMESDERGMVSADILEEYLDDDVALVMLTNPNTLGIFEENIVEVAEKIHAAGAQLYMDGANMNALLGRVRPGDIGFDVMHYNLHKTFSTPHGGGGPGSGPVSVAKHLVPYLPKPHVTKKYGHFSLDFDRPKSIGRLQAFWGAFAVAVRAYTYIRQLGSPGLKKVSEGAVTNANYLLHLLEDSIYKLDYTHTPMHEFVLSGTPLREYGLKTLDLAKRLLDFGYHAPTVYFPLIVSEAIMIEPTETETKETLEEFAKAMKKIAEEAKNDPDKLHMAPVETPVRRLDEVKAIKEPVLRW